MTVRTIMNPEVISVTKETDLYTASSLMAEHDVGCLPMVASSGRVEGMLTDRDIVLRCVAKGWDPLVCTVGDAMTRAAACVSPDHPVEDALELMRAEQVHRLPVVEQGKLKGMISLGDLAKARREDAEISEALAEISTPYHWNDL